MMNEISIKVNVDCDEAIKKLERLKQLVTEITGAPIVLDNDELRKALESNVEFYIDSSEGKMTRWEKTTA